MARIEVRANPLTNFPGVSDPSHLVIRVVRDDGSSTFFRGGPGSGREDRLGVTWRQPLGQVVTDSGPYVPGSIDWQPNATVTYQENIPESEVPSVLAQFQGQLDAIEAARIRYEATPVGRGVGNSNSVVGTLMRNVRGVDLNISNNNVEFGNSVTAPGENVQLVDRNGQRVATSSGSEEYQVMANSVEQREQIAYTFIERVRKEAEVSPNAHFGEIAENVASRLIEEYPNEENFIETLPNSALENINAQLSNQLAEVSL